MALDFPTSPTNGQIYGAYVYDSATGAWRSKGGAAAATYMSATAPSGAVNGDLWFNTNEGRLNAYYVDGDSSQWVEIRSAGDPFISQNYLINGDFGINQRSFTSLTNTNGYGFDRWAVYQAGGTTHTPQTFAPGSAPVAGYEGKNFARLVTSGQTLTTDYTQFVQKIESVRTLSGQTVTLSFWARAGSGTPKVAVELQQSFGTGGSSGVNLYAGSVTLSTSWARYSVTYTLPSIAGATIGSSNDDLLAVNLWLSGGSAFNSRTGSLGIQSNTFDFWGIQLESGATANPFRRNAPSLQGELDACMRYYYRMNAGTADGGLVQGQFYSSTELWCTVTHPVPMRTCPTASVGTFGTYRVYAGGGGDRGFGSFTTYGTSATQTSGMTIRFVVSNGVTAGYGGWFAGTSAYLQFDSEL